MAPRTGFEPVTTRLTAECSTIEPPRNALLLPLPVSYLTPTGLLLYCFFWEVLAAWNLFQAAPSSLSRQRPTLPREIPLSTIGDRGLNFCVRYGYRCDPASIITRIFSYSLSSLPLPQNYTVLFTLTTKSSNLLTFSFSLVKPSTY